MTTFNADLRASEMAKLFEVDGEDRSSGTELKMDLDAILEYTMKKYRSKTGEVLNDGWDEESEEE